MKTIFVAVSIIAIVACSKDNLDQGYWIIAQEQHNIISTTRNNNNGYFVLSGIDSHSSPDTIEIYFSSMPTTSAKYTVVRFEDTTSLAFDEMGFRVSTFSKEIYYSTGIGETATWRPADKADLTIENGKIRIEIPKMTTRSENSNAIDSFYIQGIVREK